MPILEGHGGGIIRKGKASKMKIVGFNASPRKNGNTMTLVETVLKGAASKGAETRLVNLHELNMKGCM